MWSIWRVARESATRLVWKFSPKWASVLEVGGLANIGASGITVRPKPILERPFLSENPNGIRICLNSA